MTIFDADRGRLHGTAEHLAVLAQTFAGNEPDADLAAVREQLEAAGAVHQGEVAPVLRDLVATVAAPQLLLDIETSSPAGVVQHAVALRERHCWVMEGWAGTDEVTWWPVEPGLLVPVTAMVVGLRRHREWDQQQQRVAFTLPLDLLERGLDVLRRGGTDHRETALRVAREGLSAELAPETSGRALALLDGYQGAWRVTAVDAGSSTTGARGLVVVDAGPRGYWLRSAPLEPLRAQDLRPDTPVTLTPSSPGAVWEMLTDLLTGGDQVQAA